MLVDDADLIAALSDNPEQAAAWVEEFTRVTKPRGNISSHTLAKQLYWLTGSDPSDDSNYHLLAPLFATSLAHRVYQTVNADRFDEASKNARKARREGQFTDHILHDYPNMAVQKLGGTKPQNISYLNSNRKGDNYLLASLPPRWKSVNLKPLLHTDSMFRRFGQRPDVKLLVRDLRAFLKSDPTANVTTRDGRDALVTALVGELLVFGAEVRMLPPGWSQSPDCDLSSAERQWLDPEGAAAAAEQSGEALPASSVEQISHAFGRWLNRQMRDPCRWVTPNTSIGARWHRPSWMSRTGSRTMQHDEENYQEAVLVLPRLRVQNANAISSPMTWGFPSITAFIGLMYALARRLQPARGLEFRGVGVICHDYEAQVTEGGYTRAFRQMRNPVSKDGSTAGIVEEGTYSSGHHPGVSGEPCDITFGGNREATTGPGG